MEELIYSNEIVRTHPFYRFCNSTLNSVSNRDYPGTDYFRSDIECLDMDTYEKNVSQSSNPECTVDAVIGVSNYVSNKPSNTRLMLIELRMGYENVGNLSKSVLENKISHTRSLLGAEIPIDKKSYFIFSEKAAPQANSVFHRFRKEGGKLACAQSCSVSDFSQIFKSISEFPYKPIYEQSIIETDLLAHEQSQDWEKFFTQIKYWCNKAYSYKYKNIAEYKSLSQIVKTYWRKFKSQRYDFDDEDLLKIEIIEEDYSFLLDKA